MSTFPETQLSAQLGYRLAQRVEHFLLGRRRRLLLSQPENRCLSKGVAFALH
jgi:hypothetical protein